MDGQKAKPACTNSEWVYPGYSNCKKALITAIRALKLIPMDSESAL